MVATSRNNNAIDNKYGRTSIHSPGNNRPNAKSVLVDKHKFDTSKRSSIKYDNSDLPIHHFQMQPDDSGIQTVNVSYSTISKNQLGKD